MIVVIRRFHSKPCYERGALSRASATRALNRTQYSDRSWRLGFHEARARIRQYSSAHLSSDLTFCWIAASTRARSLAARTSRVPLQIQGDFPQPVHSPFARRALFRTRSPVGHLNVFSRDFRPSQSYPLTFSDQSPGTCCFRSAMSGTV
jgi:hypothetical protein